jgi:hypothetical protein
MTYVTTEISTAVKRLLWGLLCTEKRTYGAVRQLPAVPMKHRTSQAAHPNLIAHVHHAVLNFGKVKKELVAVVALHLVHTSANGELFGKATIFPAARPP